MPSDKDALRRWKRMIKDAWEAKFKVIACWARVDAMLASSMAKLVLENMPGRVMRRMKAALAPSGSSASPITNMAAGGAVVDCNHQDSCKVYGNKYGTFRKCNHCGKRWKKVGGRRGDTWEEMVEKPTSSRRGRGSSSSASSLAVPVGDNQCPLCKGDMILRFSQTNDQWFKGCLTFPKCRGTRSLTSQKYIDLGNGLRVPLSVAQHAGTAAPGGGSVAAPKAAAAASSSSSSSSAAAEGPLQGPQLPPAESIGVVAGKGPVAQHIGSSDGGESVLSDTTSSHSVSVLESDHSMGL
jgi:ssDNA-binding Zn-finger/Zn-ribbon topoisomerase 1